MKLQKRAEIQGEKKFLGVPVKDFERAGREQLAYLLTAGLNPESKVVDFGCGVLRGGYWLIQFLNPGNYHGIEPHKERLATGIQNILEPEMVEIKRPRFDTNPFFDTSVFGEKFDFFLAYSVWTHASRLQVQATLDSFVRDSTEDGVFLTTYLPASWKHWAYRGDQWYGTSHQSDVPGCIHHSLRWIKANCVCRGLMVSELQRDRTHGQSWLEITRRGSQNRH
jgi:hypothetical protein